MKSKTYQPPKPWPHYLIAVLASLSLATALLSSKALGGPVMLKGAAFQCLTLLATAVWAVLAWQDRRYRPNIKNPLVIAALVWVGYLFLVNMFVTIDPGRTFWSNRDRMIGALGHLHWVMWMVVLGSTFRTWKEWRVLLGVSNAVAVLVGAIGLTELSVQNHATWRIESTMGNAIYLADYILPHLFISLILLVRAVGWRRFIYIGTALIEFIVVFQTQTRGAIIAMALGLLVAGLGYLMVFGRNRRRSLGIGIGIIAALIVSGAIVGWLVTTDSGETWGRANLPGVTHRLLFHDFGSDRISLWRMGLVGWMEKPWLGYGLECYSEALDRNIDVEADRSLVQNWYDRSHNQFIDVLTGTGIIGFILYLTIWLAAIWLAISGMLRSPERKDKLILWLLVPLLIAQAAAIFFAFETVSATMVYWMMMGMAVGLWPRRDSAGDSGSSAGGSAEDLSGLSSKQRRQRERQLRREERLAKRKSLQDLPRVSTTVVGTALVSAFVVCWFIDWRPYVQSYDYNLGMSSMRSKPAETAEKVEKILARGTYVTHDITYNMLGRIRTQSEMVRMTREQLLPFFKVGSEYSLKTLEQRPEHFKTHLATAYILREWATEEPEMLPKAREVMETGLPLAPARPEGYEEMAEIEILSGDLEAALSYMEMAQERSRHDTSDGRIGIRKAAILAMMGRLDEAEAEISAVKDRYNLGRDYREVSVFSEYMRPGEPRPEFMEYYRKLTNRNKRDYLPRANLIITAMKSGDRGLALKHLAELEEIHPEGAKLLDEQWHIRRDTSGNDEPAAENDDDGGLPKSIFDAQ